MITDEQYLQFSPYFAQEDIEKEDSRLKFLESLKKMPQKIKDLLLSTDTIEKIINIGKTFELDEFDTEALSFAVRKVAIGEVFIGDGVEFIAAETGLPPERAKNVLGLIVNEAFASALGDVKQIQTAKFPEKFGNPTTRTQPQTQRPPVEQPEPAYESPNVIDLRNRQN